MPDRSYPLRSSRPSRRCAAWCARCLAEVAKKGLPGEHHFYISFDTTAPTACGCRNALRAQYPEHMTIILQHQFWDLAVSDAASRSACRSAAFRKSSAFRSRPSPASSIPRCSSACNSRRSPRAATGSRRAHCGEDKPAKKRRASRLHSRRRRRRRRPAKPAAGATPASRKPRRSERPTARGGGEVVQPRPLPEEEIRAGRSWTLRFRLGRATFRHAGSTRTKTRTETDSFGPHRSSRRPLWGAQTERSLHNFRIGDRTHAAARSIAALGLIKRAAAEINLATRHRSTPGAPRRSWRRRRTSSTASSTIIFRCWSGRPAPARRPT